MLLQQFPIDPRFAVKPFKKALANHIDQVLIALHILAKQHQVIGFAVQFAGFIKAGAGRHIDLAADNGLDPLLFAGFIKIDAAVHGPVVGNRQRLLAQFLGPLRQLGHPASAVQ